MIKVNKINEVHELLSFKAITWKNPFGGRALPGPAGGAYNVPPDP